MDCGGLRRTAGDCRGPGAKTDEVELRWTAEDDGGLQKTARDPGGLRRTTVDFRSWQLHKWVDRVLREMTYSPYCETKQTSRGSMWHKVS